MAFKKMQADLDPLMKGQQGSAGVDEGEEGAAEASIVVTPSRRGHAEEYQQMAIADRVILEVLRQASLLECTGCLLLFAAAPFVL